MRKRRRLRGIAARRAWRRLSQGADAVMSTPPISCGSHMKGLLGYWGAFLTSFFSSSPNIDARVAKIRLHFPWRFVTHGVVCLVVLVMLIGELERSWSFQAIAPEKEHSVAAMGGSIVSDERIAVALLNTVDVSEHLPVEMLSPSLRTPQRVVDAFRGFHILAADDTLGAIATRYNISADSLIWSNDLQNGDILAVGQALRIPRVSGLPYVIQRNDTLEDIAQRFGVTPEAITLFGPNALNPVGALPVGKEVFIPGGTEPLPEALLSLRGGMGSLLKSAPQIAGLVREMQTNLREGPGQVYSRVAQLDVGRRAQLLARYEDWVKVDVAGTLGWVHSDLLMLPDGAFTTLPETNDFPPPPPIWVWPTRGNITSYFGPRWGSFHNGVDIANRAWTPIVAARAGAIVESGWCSGYGYCVRISHGGGVQTVYGHLIDEPPVAVGDEVDVGQLIGYMGSTYDRRGGGYSTGVHLHFTITVNGKAVNPLTFLP